MYQHGNRMELNSNQPTVLTSEQEVNNLKLVLDNLNKLVDFTGLQKAQMSLQIAEVIRVVANSLILKMNAKPLNTAETCSGEKVNCEEAAKSCENGSCCAEGVSN